jgi:hypothetical protein
MPTPITTTTVNFNYKIADSLFSQTDAQNKTLPATYTGPDRIWVFVEESGKTVPGGKFYTSAEDGADIPTPLGQLKVEVVAAANPLIISIFNSRCCEFPGLTDKTEIVADGSVALLPAENIYNTYDVDNIEYNAVSKTWSTPYRAPVVTWDDILNARKGLLTASDGRIAPDMPESLKAVWAEYRQKLRDLPTTFGRGTPSETAPWKVVFPTHPGE